VDLVETRDLGVVTELEACLAGQVVVPNAQLHSFIPARSGATPYGGWGSPCGKLMRYRPAQVVYGPGTFLNRAVAAVNQQMVALETQAGDAILSAEHAAFELALGRGYSRTQASKLAYEAGLLEQQRQFTRLAEMAVQSGISGTPRIDDPQFIPQIVFDPTRGATQPKARFAYLFPTRDSALIQVRLQSSLSSSQRAQAISWIRQAVRMPMFASGYGGTYTVTGVPVVTGDLASTVTSSIAGLLIGALVVMGVMLVVVFRGRPRLLPLALALLASGITFGVAALLGGTLTMASIAVLPILIGLAVDYAIQFQSRASEAGPGARRAVLQAAREGVPALATAALATATGFLVLLLSPVPMVRGFGLLLVLGIAVALACALTAGTAGILVSERDGGRVGSAFRGAGEILRALGKPVSPVAAAARRTGNRLGALLARSTAAPGRILLVAAVLAVAGWVADTQTRVQSDVTKLVPSTLPALRDLRTLERVTGVSGELDVTVRGRDVATPATIGWMIRYEQALLAHYGYLESQGCARSTLCPALSLPDLFSAGTRAGASAAPTQSQIDSLLGAVPPYFSQAVITPDRTEATLAFGIRLMPLSRQEQVIAYMRSQLHPPGGITARLAGLPVLAADASGALSSSARRLETLAVGLLAVGIVLLIVLRRPRRAIVPLIPIALATGWSALILFLIGIPLNPMSASLGALVIAISTEFSVLLSERYRQERSAGHDPAAALQRTYRSTGSAVLASGVTAIAGFGVLVLSSITMLRDFGFVTLIDLTVSLAGVLVVLPSALALSEQEEPLSSVQRTLRRSVAALPRPRRRARVA
jgi:uncharacterized protein